MKKPEFENLMLVSL